MIKVNLLRDHAAPVQKKQKKQVSTESAKTPPLAGVLYAVIVIATVVILGYFWRDSGNAISEVSAQNQRLESDLNVMQELQRKFVELEQRKQEHLNKISIIERLMAAQKGPVRMLNAVIQSIPQNRDIWLTSLEQTDDGINLRGETRNPEVLPDFMINLSNSGFFTTVDIEQIERREEISNFSILCASR